MKKVLLLLYSLISYSLISQTLSPEAILSASGSLSNEYTQISWTLGDIQTKTYTVDELVVTQGFLQANLTVTNVVDIARNNDINIQVFPNPVKDILNLKLGAKENIPIQFQLFNLEGKLIYSEEINTQSKSGTINFNQYQNGVYILKAVSTDKSFIRAYKILYQN